MRGALSRSQLRHDAGMTNTSIILYGIRNCDTVKKARQWLDDHGQAYHFHDFKVDGVPADELDHWLRQVGWETLLNRKGTTWRKLDPAVQASATDAAGARAVMLANSSVIKRPVVAWKGRAGKDISVGFTAALWDTRVAKGN